MQISSNIGAHTLALFGVQARGPDQQAGASKQERTPAVIDQASSFRPARSTEMQGVYLDPRTAGPTQATEPGIAQRTIDVLKGVYDTEMRVVERALQGEVEAALGRQLSSGESIHRLSEEDRISLPDSLRWSTHDLWSAGLDMRIAMGETKLVSSYFAMTGDNRDASAEELIDAAIASDVDAQLKAIQRAKGFAREDALMDLAHAETGGFSKNVRSALAANSEEEIGAMRDELIAARKARIVSGERSVTVEAEKLEVVPTGYGQGGTGAGGAALSFHVLRFA